jgi:hypothetical protein
MYADRSLRSNQPREAINLLTAALNEAGTLRAQAAYLLGILLEQRANVYESLADLEAAAADRKTAGRMLSMPPETDVLPAR